MNIMQALKLASERLQKSSTPVLDARVLLAFAMNYTYEQLLINYDKILPSDLEEKFFQLVTRRQSMEPVAYIIGKKEFYGLEFFVNKNVLIPRPDTEILIDTLLDDYNKTHQSEPVKILELGTGSGAIAVTIANEIITSEITAVDISDDALVVAKKNAEFNKVLAQIQFVKSDWYSNVDKQKYDYIISNPPYISKDDTFKMSEETYRFEPEIALYAEDDGFSAYKMIISSARKYLKSTGKLILEIGFSQKESILSILKYHNFTKFITVKDLANHDRVIVASY